MLGKFAYSFDRETFQGVEETRPAALKTALNKATQFESLPEAVYIGKRVPADAGSSGLAQMIVDAIRRRVRQEIGGMNSQYLIRVNKHQLAELDDEIDRVVCAWLRKHDLMPTHSKIIAISEHAILQPKMNTSDNSSNTEVADIGESEYPVSRM